MPPEERTAAFLWDMCEACRKLQRYVGDRTYRDFSGSELLQDAVLRTLTVLGEAAARVDASYRDSHPEIPWKRIVGLRNVVTHQYDRVNIMAIWDAATMDVAQLLPQLERMVEAAQDDDVAGEPR